MLIAWMVKASLSIITRGFSFSAAISRVEMTTCYRQMEPKRALVLFALVTILSFTLDYAHGCSEHKNWNYFVFSQWWPQSQCYYKDIDTMGGQRFNGYGFKNNCVPADVKTWTIHGLWPTIDGTPNPCYCNNFTKFNVSKIEDLKPQLMKQWLALPEATESESENLWDHEWNKHGTCAASLPALNSQHSYFKKTLTLNQQYNLLEMLSNVGITPSDDKSYEVEDFEDAITKQYGVKGRVICLYGPDDDKYLGGIRICMNKTFQLMDCEVTYPERCNRGDSIKYPVIIPQSSTKF